MQPLKVTLFFSTALLSTAYFELNAMAQDAAATAAPVLSADEKRAIAARQKGVYEPDLTAFLAHRDPAVQPYYKALFSEGERNAVLNFDRIGLIEMERHNFKDAAYAFDQAALRIEAIYADDPNAAKAKSLWTAEAIKDYKGEPYERAMTFYYRGLAKLMANDYENARANFKAAEQQTLMAEGENYSTSSFAALTYLSGWASHCAGDDSGAGIYYTQAVKANPALHVPDANDNLLIIGETGIGPSKARQGKYGEQMRMNTVPRSNAYSDFVVSGQAWAPPAPPPVVAAAPPPPAPAVVDAVVKGKKGAKVAKPVPLPVTVVAAAPPPPPPPPTADAEMHGIEASDISLQSTTRDGRPVEVILKGKAQFKETAGAVGTAAVDTGAMLMAASNGNSNMANMGAGMAIFGLIADVAAAAANPAADIRYWDTLPGTLDFATAQRRVGDHTVKWSVVDAKGQVMRGPEDMYVSPGAVCAVAWARERTSLGTPASAPNADYGSKLDSARLVKDAGFRADLLTDFSLPRDSAAPVPAQTPAPASGLISASTTTDATK